MRKAWRRKERRESGRFANLMTCLTGVPADEMLPEQDPEDEAAAIAAEHKRLAEFAKKNL